MEIRLLKTLENLMVAVTFAEKNLDGYALQILNSDGKRKNKNQTNTKHPQLHGDQPRMRL